MDKYYVPLTNLLSFDFSIKEKELLSKIEELNQDNSIEEIPDFLKEEYQNTYIDKKEVLNRRLIWAIAILGTLSLIFFVLELKKYN